MRSDQNKIATVLEEMDQILGSRDRTIEILLAQFLQFLLVAVEPDQLESADSTERLCDLWLNRRCLRSTLKRKAVL